MCVSDSGFTSVLDMAPLMTVHGPCPKGSGPKEPYNRKKHYGNTPTAADRTAVGGSPDHQPPLVQRYYEGDPAIGEPPGHTMTPAQRKASGADRNRMGRSNAGAQRSQGADMSRYSREQKKKHGF